MQELERRIYGRIAETIIEQLCRDTGFLILHNGLEHAMPMSSVAPVQNAVMKDINRRPDFVVFDESTPYYIEVKYRTNGLSAKDKQLFREYPVGTVIVIVRPHALQAIVRGDDRLRLLAHVMPFCKNPALVFQYTQSCKNIF
jgi:hypothetical protein